MNFTITEAIIEKCAAAAHNVNQEYCENIGDFSQPPWLDAPTWQRDSVRAGARYLLEHSLASDADSHNSWLAEKERAGWVYGPTKDPEAKTHPCIMPYRSLPREQRAKDTIFRVVVMAVASTLGYQP